MKEETMTEERQADRLEDMEAGGDGMFHLVTADISNSADVYE